MIHAKTGGDHGLQLWQHECGHVEDVTEFAKPDDETVIEGCDACESAPGQWRRLYAKAKFS